MALGFKAYSQNEKVRHTKKTRTTNLTGQYNKSTKHNLKNNPQKQTDTISRMRMAIGFKAYSQNEKVRYTKVSELYQARIGKEDNARLIL